MTQEMQCPLAGSFCKRGCRLDIQRDRLECRIVLDAQKPDESYEEAMLRLNANAEALHAAVKEAQPTDEAAFAEKIDRVAQAMDEGFDDEVKSMADRVAAAEKGAALYHNQSAEVTTSDPNVPLLSDETLAQMLENRPHRRVTKEGIEARIADTRFFHDGTMTICIITMENGFKVHGMSAPVVAQNYDEAIGKKVAYEQAFDSLWPLEGYLLAERFYFEDHLRSQASGDSAVPAGRVESDDEQAGAADDAGDSTAG